MNYILCVIAPFVLSLIFTPLVRIFAIRYGLVSHPRADRWHKSPTALLGGMGIYLASVIPAFFLTKPNKNVIGLFLGATFLLIVGLIDDKFHLRPYTKLFAQIVAGCIIIFFGVTIGLSVDVFLIIPLTLLWIVGVTNSFNLLDNIDGLCAGIAAISGLMLFFSSLFFSNNPLGIYGLILFGATIGFLPYNFNPAKIFMGDSGSMFLGYSLAVISIGGITRHLSSLLTTMLIPVLILSVPIFDTLFVMVVRKLQGKRMFQGGKDHTSHRLVTLGLSQRKTVLLLYGISIAFGLIAISYSTLSAFIISIIAFLAIVILLFFGFFLTETTSDKEELKTQEKFNKLYSNKTILNNILLHKRRIVEVLLDLWFICIAYTTSYFLRFEGSLFSTNVYLLKGSLIWIILIKMSFFFMFGLYHGVWRYISITDLLTIFKVVSLSSAASILLLTFLFRFQEYSRAVFFIDWLLLLFLISGSRILFRVLGEFFSRIREKGKNILIYGAGDAGEMVAREIKRNKSLNYNAVGFIDDNLSKIGNRIHGIAVIGSREGLTNIILEKDIKEVLIAIPSLDNADFIEITKLCNQCGIPYKKIKGILDEDEIDRLAKT